MEKKAKPQSERERQRDREAGREGVGSETQWQREADGRVEVGHGRKRKLTEREWWIEEVYLLLLCQHHLSPVNSLPVLRGCMTEINQRAIVHTLSLMRRPIDTGIRRGMVRKRGRWRVQAKIETGYEIRRNKNREEKRWELVIPKWMLCMCLFTHSSVSQKSFHVCMTTEYSSSSLVLKLYSIRKHNYIYFPE